MYVRLEVFSRYKAQDGVSSEHQTKNISAVRKLYLSKELTPKEGYTIVFKNGQNISDWLDDKPGYSKELIGYMRSEPCVGFYAEKACYIWILITKRLSDFVASIMHHPYANGFMTRSVPLIGRRTAQRK